MEEINCQIQALLIILNLMNIKNSVKLTKWNFDSLYTEPVGAKSPKFSTNDKSSLFFYSSGEAFALLCPAQGFPVPMFRYGITDVFLFVVCRQSQSEPKVHRFLPTQKVAYIYIRPERVLPCYARLRLSQFQCLGKLFLFIWLIKQIH